MALAESINIKIENTLTILINRETDVMVIGGIASNLLITDGYLTVTPFLVNARVEQGNPFQLQTKVFIPAGTKVESFVSDAPVNLLWNSEGFSNWNSGSPYIWDVPQPGLSSVLVNLSVAAV